MSATRPAAEPGHPEPGHPEPGHPQQANPNPFPGGRPAEIRAPHGARTFELRWKTGEGDVRHAISHRVLRGYCPCAGCQGHSGEIRLQTGGNEELREIEPVGRYALTLKWGDGHATGIYSFEFLWRLGELVRCLGEDGTLTLEVLPRSATPRAG